MLPPKKPAQSVTPSNYRVIYFPSPIDFYRHLDWEGQMWDELSALTRQSQLEACESNLGECAVQTSLDLNMAIDLEETPTNQHIQ